MDNSINEILTNALNAVGDMADVKTIIGEPIKTESGTTIIPVSRVSFGVVSGGIDFLKGKNGSKTADGNGNVSGEKSEADKKSPKSFGGGGGTGISATPVGFLVIYPSGEVQLLNVGAPEGSSNIVDSISSLLQKSPDIISRLKGVLGGKEDEKETLKKDAEDILGDDEKYGKKENK